MLLLNASLTISADGMISPGDHLKFWEPIVTQIVEIILQAKSASPVHHQQQLVFAWWGDKAKKLKKTMESLAAKYPAVRVAHCVNCNPAAQGDLFSKGDTNPFTNLNETLVSMGAPKIDFLPTEAKAKSHVKMDAFVKSTLELHAAFLERLGDLEHVTGLEFEPITLPQRPASLVEAICGIDSVVDNVELCAVDALDVAQEASLEVLQVLEPDQIAAVHLYTQPGRFYKTLNESLRSPDRSHVKPFLPYLSLLISALDALPSNSKGTQYRGVALDLRKEYVKGSAITWWSVSSCTTDKAVAEAFMGVDGPRTMFVLETVHAVAISHLSAIPEEQEVLVLPGTQMLVKSIVSKSNGLSIITLIGANKSRLVK